MDAQEEYISFHSQEAITLYAEGRELVEAGRLKEAIPVVEQLAQIETESTFVLERLRWLYDQEIRALLNEEKKQLRTCRTGCCSLPPGQSRTRLHESAINALEKFIDLGKVSADEYYRLYWHLHHLGRYAEGVDACHKTIKIDPGYKLAYHGLGCAQQRLGHVSKAAASKKAVELDPEDKRGYELLADCYLLLHDKTEMSEVYENALERFPEHTPFIRGVYNKRFEEGRYEEALTLAERGIALDPEEHSGYVARGNVLRKLDRCDDAIESFREAVRFAPGSSHAWKPLVKALREAGWEDEAVDVLMQQAKRPVEDVVQGTALGGALRRAGQLTLAKTVFESVIVSNGEWTDAHIGLGKTLEALGDANAARAAHEKAASSMERMLKIQKRAEEDLRRYPKDEDAAEYLKDGKNMALIRAHLYTQSVRIYLQTGDLQKARENLQLLKHLDPEQAEKFERELEGRERSQG